MSEQILMPIGENSQKALTSLEKAREAHERYLIRQQNSDLQEAIEYYEMEGLNKVVVKPIYSAGSVGVRICENKEEMVNSIEEVLS